MSMFQGRSALSLDAKGRMSVPTRHREALMFQCEGRLTLTRHPDGCLLLYPRPVWETVRECCSEWVPISSSGTPRCWRVKNRKRSLAVFPRPFRGSRSRRGGRCRHGGWASAGNARGLHRGFGDQVGWHLRRRDLRAWWAFSSHPGGARSGGKADRDRSRSAGGGGRNGLAGSALSDRAGAVFGGDRRARRTGDREGRWCVAGSGRVIAPA